MPCYPALALLIGSALTEPRAASWIRKGHLALAGIAILAFGAIGVILSQVWSLPAPGDISRALTQHPEAYTLSLGHMGDLTLASFAYLANSPPAGGSRIPGGRDLCFRTAADIGHRGDDGAVYPRRAAGVGGIRSLPRVEAIGGSAQSRAARHADSRRSVLRILLRRVLCGGLSRPTRAAIKRPRQQS